MRQTVAGPLHHGSHRTPATWHPIRMPKRGPTRLRPHRRRLIRHLVLGAAVAMAGSTVVVLLDSEDGTFLLSMATAYASLLLLGATLVIGPWNVMRGRSNPVSTHLRRDLGIWAGLVALLHMGAGLQVHLQGSMERYFVFPPGQGVIPLRYDAFGVVNWLGLVGAGIIVVLLAISNDRSLIRLGTERWKQLQRWSYGLFVLVLVHGVGYQFIEGRPAAWVGAVTTVAAAAVAMQLIGYRVTRSRSRGNPHRKRGQG